MIEIKILSVPICAWCYIEKKCFDYAFNQFDHNLFQIKWVPFQLNPNMPKDGIDRKEYLIKKFGSEKKTAEVYATIIEQFQINKIKFNLSNIKFTPNTMNANRLIYWGQLKTKGGQIIDKLFKSYFLNGKNLGDLNFLIKLGISFGFDKRLIMTQFKSNLDIENLLNMENKYRTAGVSGIPTFILDNTYIVPGAQTEKFWLRVFHEIEQKNRRTYI